MKNRRLCKYTKRETEHAESRNYFSHVSLVLFNGLVISNFPVQPHKQPLASWIFKLSGYEKTGIIGETNVWEYLPVSFKNRFKCVKE